MLHNLLWNALEHTTTGMITARVDGQRIVVRDTGSGVAPEAQQPTCDRRYRSTDGRSGMGIGLYLVQRICNLQPAGWDIRVDSKPDTGTTFTNELRNQGIRQKTPEMVPPEGTLAA